MPKFRVSEMLGLRAFCNPSVDEMAHYILGGRRMTWPTLNHIRHNLAIERTLSDCLSKLRRQSYLSFRSKALDSSGVSHLTLNPDVSPRTRQRSEEQFGFHVQDRPLTPEGVRRGDVPSFDDDGDMVNQQPQQGGGTDTAEQEGGGPPGCARMRQTMAGGGLQEVQVLKQEVQVLRHENEKLRALLNEVLQSTVHHHDDAVDLLHPHHEPPLVTGNDGAPYNSQDYASLGSSILSSYGSQLSNRKSFSREPSLNS